jgi:glycerol-3-phosphate dehydrogenase
MAINGRLDARNREALFGRLAGTEFDVLVIGGGVTGTGAALDAASRGLRVALVEAQDVASGTSSRSSKLIHGGLRYLEQLDFKLVSEALRERDLLISRLAPHLVKPVSFLYPLHRKLVERPYVGAGLVLYDAMNVTKKQVPFHRHMSTAGAMRLAPALKASTLAGALLYYDAQTDDARFTLTVARTAAAHGAVIATRARAVGLLRDAEDGRVTGARVRDTESGREVTVAARRVIVCAGVWTDQVHELAGVRAGYQVRMSKGVHVVVPYEAIRSDTGIILRTEKSVLFIIPWGQRWIVGTTDTDWSGDRSDPAPAGEDIDYILGQANRVLVRPLTRSDVIGVYAGLRPLVAADESAPTTKLSREHVIDRPVPGLVSIAGGKFTTYRVMARDVVDAAVADYDRWVPASVTDQLPLLGAEGLAATTAEAGRLAEDYGVPRDAVEHLLDRYGTLAEEVLELTRTDPSLAGPLLDGYPYLGAEAAYAVTHEGALHVADVLTRRLRLFFEAPEGGAAAAGRVAAIMGGLLGWDAAAGAAELESYLDFARAETRAIGEVTARPPAGQLPGGQLPAGQAAAG